MNPYLLESLYERWGRPRWFWPAVLLVMLALWLLASIGEEP